MLQFSALKLKLDQRHWDRLSYAIFITLLLLIWPESNLNLEGLSQHVERATNGF